MRQKPYDQITGAACQIMTFQIYNHSQLRGALHNENDLKETLRTFFKFMFINEREREYRATVAKRLDRLFMRFDYPQVAKSVASRCNTEL